MKNNRILTETLIVTVISLGGHSIPAAMEDHIRAFAHCLCAHRAPTASSHLGGAGIQVQQVLGRPECELVLVRAGGNHQPTRVVFDGTSNGARER